MKRNRNELLCMSEESAETSTDNVEVEIDEEAKKIINSPGKCLKTLLDVTIIKPHEANKLYTVHRKTLVGADVRKIIKTMNRDRRTRMQLINEILGQNAEDCLFHKPAAEPKHKEPANKEVIYRKIKKFCDNNDTNLDEIINVQTNRKVEQVYATPRTFHDLNSMFKCKNNNRRDVSGKPEKPCTCRNCALVGVVRDSQKWPHVGDTRTDSKRDLRSDRKRKVNFRKEEDHNRCMQYIKHLSNRMKELEERVRIQEELAVPKDYFKTIIARLVYHLTKLARTPSLHKETKKTQADDRSRYCDKTTHTPTTYSHPRYNIHSLLVNPPPQAGHSSNSPRTYDTTIPSEPVFWKWGEEILKPGIDIKNKVTLLLDDILKHLKDSKDFPSRTVDIKHVIEDAANNLYRVIRDKQNSASTSKKPVVHSESSITISYLNPEWEESVVSVEFDTSDQEQTKSPDELNEFYKAEFLRMIRNTKADDRLRLWDSIWGQCIANGQDRNNTAVIQFPLKQDRNLIRNVEIHYTIGELEELLNNGITNTGTGIEDSAA